MFRWTINIYVSMGSLLVLNHSNLSKFKQERFASSIFKVNNNTHALARPIDLRYFANAKAIVFDHTAHTHLQILWHLC